MLRIWIFFNKQTIYLEETTAQRKNQIAERAGANLGRSHSWKYRHPQQSTYPWEVFSADLFAIFKAIYWGNCTWINLSRLTAPFICFREFELDYGYLMTYCFSRKISGREIAGVWKLAKLVTADWSTGDSQRWREMSESDVNTSLYQNGLLVVLVLNGRISLKLVCISIHGKISSVMNLLFGSW